VLLLVGARATDCPAEGAAPAPGAGDRRTVGAIERALLDTGLENVTVSPGDGIQIVYENRRYRRSAEALGLVRAAAGEPVLVGERRLGLVAAALQPLERPGREAFRVLYPSDRGFPGAPRGPVRSATWTRPDLDVGALVDYRVGRIFDPLQVRAQLEPRLILNPWSGARARLGVLLPLQSDFPESDLDPDLNRVRLGRASLDQFGWIPGISLVSFSGGYFGDNRYGLSAGAARPLQGGDWLLDAQIDRTGFVAFTEDGTLYSRLDRTSGFAGLTWRPPFADLALRLRGGQFLYGDRGVDLEVQRSFDDIDLAYFVQDAGGVRLFGVRLDLPVPPLTRASGTALRVQPTPRFAASFRDRDEARGRFLDGVASRTEFLRQLDRNSLAAGADRYRRALGEASSPRPRATSEWVSFTGMTGFVHTPWAGVLADRGIELGYDQVPKRWAYDHRGTHDNQILYATLGFVRRVETSLRWTRIPGYHSFEEIAPDSRLVDMDRMASARVALLEPSARRPGVAVGVEDAQGTRRFHSTYAVAGLPFAVSGMPARASAGYGFHVWNAARRVLDGFFGAGELSPRPWLRTQLEYDSEKWNVGIGLRPVAGLQLRAALLHMESVSVGAGWSQSL
jgi:hypothetical protein